MDVRLAMKCSIVWTLLLITSVLSVRASPSTISSRLAATQYWRTDKFIASPARLAREFFGTMTVEVEDETEKILYADRNQHPFMVGIFKFKEVGFRFACGASLITTNKVLTAAHCVTYNRTEI